MPNDQENLNRTGNGSGEKHEGHAETGRKGFGSSRSDGRNGFGNASGRNENRTDLEYGLVGNGQGIDAVGN